MSDSEVAGGLAPPMGKGRAHWHNMQTLSLRICTASVNIYWMTPAINQPNVALIVCQQVLIVCQQVQVPQMVFACGVGKTILPRAVLAHSNPLADHAK